MKPNRNTSQPNFKKIVNGNSSVPKTEIKHNIHDLEAGDYYKGTVKILRKVKPGPLILSVFDGSGTIDAIGRDSLFTNNADMQDGAKTYDFGNIQIKDNRNKNKSQSKSANDLINSDDDLNVDDVVAISGEVSVHKNRLEIELDSIVRATMDFDAVMQTRSQPMRETFSIDSDRYESMKQTFLAIAQRIRHSIFDQQPILIRHHNDADGICAGLAIEQAIKNVMLRRNILPKKLLYRSPSITPFYDPIDLFRDISKFKSYSDQFGDKPPLLLLLDTGSTPENTFPMQVLQSLQLDCIIVDHHNPGLIEEGKSGLCDMVQFHLNPYLFGWDSQTCGGMLCYELARFIDEDIDQPLYPAVAGLADRCNIPEVDSYIENTGMTKETLIQMGRVLDYLAYHFKFDSGEGVYEQVFTNPGLVEVISKKVTEDFDSKLASILPALQTEQVNSVWFTELDLEIYTQRGKYPTPGKVLGMVHDYLVDQKNPEPVFTIGYFSDGIIIRATHPILPVPTLLQKLQAELPEANVDGGGHEQAGSLKYVTAHGNSVRHFVRDLLSRAIIEEL